MARWISVHRIRLTLVLYLVMALTVNAIASDTEVTPIRIYCDDTTIVELPERYSIPPWIPLSDDSLGLSEHQFRVQKSSQQDSCPSILDIQLDLDNLAAFSNVKTHKCEIYSMNLQLQVDQYLVDSNLNYTMTTLPIDSASPSLAEDLNRDGNIELVCQAWDALRIYTAPDWTLLNTFVFVGLVTDMQPRPCNVDGDPQLELFVNASGFGNGGILAVFDYDTTSNSYHVLDTYNHSLGLSGRVAIGDFDEDGRTEFIAGGSNVGYELFEWQDTALVYVGHVGNTLTQNVFYAIECRPLPGNKLHALLGSSNASIGYQYDLIAATGDNTFEIVHTFLDGAGTVGRHPSVAADVDCDGLDELMMFFGTTPTESWGWDVDSSTFLKLCDWDFPTYGSFKNLYTADLTQDGRSEWLVTNTAEMLHVFGGTECDKCDSVGHCLNCPCACLGDPVCDSIVDVFDVVAAVDIAFRGAPPQIESIPSCYYETTDVTCDFITDVFDVVAMVDVAFRSVAPDSAYCMSCQ